MRNLVRALGAVLAAAALAIGGAGTAVAKPGGVPAIPLNNEQETTGAAGGASGFFSYEIEGDQLCWELEVRDLTQPAFAAHIHLAPRNTAGGIVVPLVVGTGTSFTTSGCAVPDAVVLAAIAADPGDYYVNVHTPTYPGGEVRGQLK